MRLQDRFKKLYEQLEELIKSKSIADVNMHRITYFDEQLVVMHRWRWPDIKVMQVNDLQGNKLYDWNTEHPSLFSFLGQRDVSTEQCIYELEKSIINFM